MTNALLSPVMHDIRMVSAQQASLGVTEFAQAVAETSPLLAN